MTSMSVNVSMNGKLTHVTLGALDVWFSYSTAVAFWVAGERLVISENVWGPTTGRHLNAIDTDKDIRIPRAEFEAKLNATMARVELVNTP